NIILTYYFTRLDMKDLPVQKLFELWVKGLSTWTRHIMRMTN
ncbi:29237_t:CDS:2, partial [Racocetra persica]